MADERAATAIEEPKAGFLKSRWLGRVPLKTLFWRDMIAVGTAINVATTLGSIIAFANDAPTWLGFGIYLLPLPWNIFLTVAVWRTAQRRGGSWAELARLASACWLIFATLI